MKKGLLLICCALILTTGCGKEKEETKKLVCTNEMTEDTSKINSTYKVTYTGDYVDKVETVEKVTDDSAEKLNTYKKAVEQVYKAYDEIKGYDYEVTIDGNTLTSTLNADYTKIDMDKFLKVNEGLKSAVENGKIKVELLKTTYKALGATCKEE